VVYGGGGIMPDYFVPVDTSNTSVYFGKLNYQGIFYLYGFRYVDGQRKTLKGKYKEKEFIENFRLTTADMQAFYDFAEEKGIDYDEEGAKISSELIRNRLKAVIGRNLFGDKVFYQIVNQMDETVEKAEELLSEEEI